MTSPLEHLMTFVFRSFVPDSSQDSSGAGGVPPPRVCGAWVEVLPLLASSGSNEALSSAINAFAAAVMSGGTGSTTMVSSARESYSQALSALRNELRFAPKAEALPSQIIASIMCLLLAELFQPTTLGSWMAHLHGFGQSMQLARPEFYASGIPHRLFVGVRPILVSTKVFAGAVAATAVTLTPAHSDRARFHREEDDVSRRRGMAACPLCRNTRIFYAEVDGRCVGHTNHPGDPGWHWNCVPRGGCRCCRELSATTCRLDPLLGEMEDHLSIHQNTVIWMHRHRWWRYATPVVSDHH